MRIIIGDIIDSIIDKKPTVEISNDEEDNDPVTDVYFLMELKKAKETCRKIQKLTETQGYKKSHEDIEELNNLQMNLDSILNHLYFIDGTTTNISPFNYTGGEVFFFDKNQKIIYWISG